MNLIQINKAFAEVVNRRGIYNELDVAKNTVAQYRYKLRKGVHITLDKKVSILQRAGYPIQQHEWTDQNIVEAIRFALKSGKAAKEYGAEYLFTKWKAKRAPHGNVGL